MGVITGRMKLKDLQKFLTENKEQIHDLLNHMWQTIERIALQLEDTIPDIDLDNSHGNFIRLNDGWDESYYANPTISFPYGEIGFSLDGLFSVFSIAAKKINEDNIAEFMKLSREHEFLSVELYGGDNCFTTFYDSKNEDDIDAMIKSIKDSKEDIIQLEISIETITDEVQKNTLIEVIISTYNYLESKKLLEKLPEYQTFD